MKEDKVLFRGVLGGLEVQTDSNIDLDTMLLELVDKLKTSKSFFAGSKVNLFFSSDSFSDEEKGIIEGRLSGVIDIGNIEFGRLNEKKDKTKDLKIEAYEEIRAYNTDEGMTRFIKGTVRNGQRIEYRGNIVVMGDVNPGAEVVAGGNIIVLGNLRGMAHAGAYGDMMSIVMALKLQPTQLRIGSIITRPPEEDIDRTYYPEMALIRGENLFIEPYISGKIK